jgi:hypothetical protein
MMIGKLSLPRRTVLRGLGATVALPLLDAMVPAATVLARSAAAAKHRLGFFYVPSGMPLLTFLPKEEGAIHELPPILTPLNGFKDKLVVVSGLSNAPADDLILGSGPHTRCGSAWLNGVRPKRTEGADIAAGTTIDQFCAPVLGQGTALTSLELAMETTYAVGNCDNGFSCTYINTFSWKTPTTPNPMENNPRIVFERLFGEGGTAEARKRQLRGDRSVLDFVGEDLAKLQRSIGPGDRARVDEYLASVRDVEQRIERAETQAANTPLPASGLPVGIPDSYDEHARLMIDLLYLAYQADITRVATFQLNREQSAQNYPWIGVNDGHHDCSHHNGNPQRIETFSKINQYHCSLVARLVEKMAGTPDGDGTLLDHSMLLFGSGMGDGSVHSPHDLPSVIVGGGCGQLKGGRHVKYALDTPHMNLLLTMGHKAGVDLFRIGDSTGDLAGL